MVIIKKVIHVHVTATRNRQTNNATVMHFKKKKKLTYKAT